MIERIFFWIGVATVSTSSLIIFSMMFYIACGWAISRMGLKRHAEMGEAVINHLLSFDKLSLETSDTFKIKDK